MFGSSSLDKLVNYPGRNENVNAMSHIVNSMGPSTMLLATELYQLNRSRLLVELNSSRVKQSVILLQGGDETNYYDTEIQYRFKQESFFMWLFGVNEPGCYGLIDIESRETYLFMPKFDSHTAWKEPPLSLEYYKNKYDVTHAYYSDVLSNVLTELDPLVIFTLGGRNIESGRQIKEPSFPGKDRFLIDTVTIYPIMTELRVFKTCHEYEVMKYVVDCSSAALKRIMRVGKPGKSEYLCECEFLNYIYGAGGCRFTSDNPICSSGKNTAYLHYGNARHPNVNYIQSDDLCLFDVGASYFGYCANLTSTFPANGKFTPDQRMIYEAVLDVNRTVIRNAKIGTSWIEMHLLGHRILLQHLQRIGIVNGELNDMLDAGLASVFQPHGIGHLIGLDKYDVGGYGGESPAKHYRDERLKNLRTTRTLKEGMFITVGPGCYFIDDLINRALKDPVLSKFMVKDAVNHFRDFGGVRIEDNVYIHTIGALNITRMPRTVEQVEDWLAGIDYDDKPFQANKRVSSVRFFT